MASHQTPREVSTSGTSEERMVFPPAPPGESAPEAVARTRAVADALVHLGEKASPEEVTEYLRTEQKLNLSVEEVAAITEELVERAQAPPESDRPPPQEARRRHGAT